MEQNGNDPVLQTLHLSRFVSGKRLVDDITVQVCRGDIMAIVGPSGAGKSLFLRLLNRLDEPTGGTVFIEGSDYRQIHARELRRQVGMVMQSPFLFPGTVADNLRFGPQQRGDILSPGSIESLLNRVGLSGYDGRDVGQLSGGEVQRISLARALANSPKVLLLDEPTSALDDASKVGIETLLLNIIKSQHITCIVVTHDLKQAARLATRIMVLEKGRLVRIGPVEEVLRAQPAFQ